jgi:hypothetical protein
MVKEGTIIRLEYSDHSEGFNAAFPAQKCVIEKGYNSKEGDDWFLVTLSQSFFYHQIENTHLLIRSRWQGFQIGDREPTGVNILLIPNDSFLKEPLDIDKFYHVAWGMVYSV